MAGPLEKPIMLISVLNTYIREQCHLLCLNNTYDVNELQMNRICMTEANTIQYMQDQT